MKKIAFFITAALLTFTAAGQTGAGNALVGGTGSGTYRSSEVAEVSHLQVNPVWGKFVADHVAFIGEVNFGYAYADNNVSTQNILSVGLLPGFKGFVPLSKQLYFTPQVKAGYVFNRSYTRSAFPGWPATIRSQYGELAFKAGLGLAAFFNTNAAFTLDLPYAHYVNISGNGQTYGQAELQLGFIIIIPSSGKAE